VQRTKTPDEGERNSTPKRRFSLKLAHARHNEPAPSAGEREKKPGAEPKSEQPAPILLKTEIRTSTAAPALGDRKKNELGPVPDGSLDEVKTRPTRAEPEFSGARDRATKTRIPAANRRDFEGTGQQTIRRPTKLHRRI
jgi:hypothetical protein